MGKMQRESGFASTHHDLQDVVVNVLAADQVERFSPRSEQQRPKMPSQQTLASAPRVSLARAKREALSVVAQRRQSVEPMNETLDHVRVQVQRMYVHRQRMGFWFRAALSMVLLSVLGFVFYYLVANTSQVEMSNFF